MPRHTFVVHFQSAIDPHRSQKQAFFASKMIVESSENRSREREFARTRENVSDSFKMVSSEERFEFDHTHARPALKINSIKINNLIFQTSLLEKHVFNG
jgi:hypothetical protein